MAGFGAKGRGGKKKLFNDYIPPGKGREDVQARQRAEKLQAHINYQPRDRYPKITYPVSPAPTLRETAIIKKWKDNQAKIRDGPLFVRRVIDSNSRVKKKAVLGSQMGNTAFNAIPTYSSRYERKFRQRPSMAGKLWLKEFLPKELWDVVDPSLRKSKTALAKPQPAKTPGSKKRLNLNDFSDGEDEEGAADVEGEDSDAEDPDAPQDEVDEDWENDEDDGDDYNAELYFDNGEGDDEPDADAEPGDDYGQGGDEHEREFDPEEEFNV